MSDTSPTPGEPRSTAVARDRITAALARLNERKPGVGEEVLQAVAQKVSTYSTSNSIWKGGIEPMPFDEFCIALDGKGMTNRQVLPFELSQTLRASNMFDPHRTITEWVLVWGKRGGKDFTISKWFAWNVYILHQLVDDPCKIMVRLMAEAGKELMLAPGARLDMVNVAPNADLARQVFFDYFKTYLKSPIMKDIPVYPPPARWSPGTDEVTFPLVNLHCYSKTSNAGGLDGYNVYRGVIDEGDEFLDNETKKTADVIHEIWRNTMLSTFGPFAAMVDISYPRYEKGFMLRLAERARKSNESRAAAGQPPLFYVDMAPTFDLRSDVKRDDPAIIEAFENDPRAASAMFDISPMSVIDQWIEFPENIKACNGTHAPIIDHKVSVTDCSNAGDGSIWRMVTELVGGLRTEPGRDYFAGFDGGKSGDSFAACVYSTAQDTAAFEWLCPEHGLPEVMMGLPYRRCGHEPARPGVMCAVCMNSPDDYAAISKPTLNGWYHLDHRQEAQISMGSFVIRIPQMREELLIEVKPQHKKRLEEVNAPVDFASLYNVAKFLGENLPMKAMGFDPWQTVMFTQALQTEVGGDIREISMSNPEQFRRAWIYKQQLYQRNIQNLPNDKADEETKYLMQKGNRIDHPPGGSKDLYDARAIACYLAAIHHCSELQFMNLNPDANPALNQL